MYFFPSRRNCNSEFYHFLAVKWYRFFFFLSHCCAVFTELIVGFLTSLSSVRLCFVNFFLVRIFSLFFPFFF